MSLHGRNLEDKYQEHKIIVEYYSYDRDEKRNLEGPDVKKQKNKPKMQKKHDNNKFCILLFIQIIIITSISTKIKINNKIINRTMSIIG